MRKKDMTTLDLLLEAFGLMAAVIYFCLQIWFGISYRADALRIIMNVLTLLLVYAGLSLLQVYPERVNNLSKEVCSGKIRTYTIHMVRDIKMIFVISLLFTSVCDVLGGEIDPAYSLIAGGLMILTAVIFELKIIRILRNEKKK